ncbi:hypothetical protein ACFQ9X_14300 [Catenulispora yoronensis]
MRKAHKEGARLAAFDSGVFVLAAAASWTAAGPPRTGCTPRPWPATTAG